MNPNSLSRGSQPWTIPLLSVLLACSCSGSSTEEDEGSASSGGTGGGDPTPSGGAPHSGGASATSGGAPHSGGAVTTGGHSAGGAAGTDGSGGLPDGGEVRAFPGAQGFAATITGGRGGRVIKVSNLAASGPGSFASALGQTGARIIVFEVSGVIEAELLEIPHGDVTIAGQSAPGAGITLKGRLWADYDSSVENIIIRHLRIRPSYDGSDGEQFDSLRFSVNRRVMLDHVSASFGVDETVDLYSAEDVTVQWSVIESASTSGHPEGEHNYGLINGPDGRRVSILHSVFAHNKNRNPALANGPAEMVNNIIYNGRHGFVHHNPASGRFHFLGNVFKAGPEDELIPFFFDDENGGSDPSLRYYFADNWVDGEGTACSPGVLENPWQICDVDSYVDESHRSAEPFDFSEGSGEYRAPLVIAGQDALDVVLAGAGAYPHDVVSRRTVREAQEGTGAWGAREPTDLMEGLTATTAPADTDDDGMPDAWEQAHDLNPEEDDSAQELASGYTAIEEYLNELAQELAP